ncbi:trimeric autotransporter adhesin [Bathymodiolus japonicus methanotrophic gill symbiont]|nr:trimeric autotransporter adhesin [Bathymodiolus japonicus methanotrophic gill symbiont]
MSRFRWEAKKPNKIGDIKMEKIKIVVSAVLLMLSLPIFADQVAQNTAGIAKNKDLINSNAASIQYVEGTIPTLPRGADKGMKLFICKDSNEIRWGSCETTYKIGDTGPSGGLVFYITDEGMHGIESSPVDQGWAEWGCHGNYVHNAGSELVGSGAKNTRAILAAGCASREGGRTAVQMTDDYELNGFDDWYLPSRDELNLMQTHLYQSGLGDFWSSMYSSSSQNTGDMSWYQYFPTGVQDVSFKYIFLRVRAVRSF